MKTGLTVASERAAIEKLAVNTIRTLCMDAVQAANSGHPGSPMGMAPTAYVLWQRFLRFDPDQTIWGNRDRFVLSAGHCSTLLYALLHLTGVKTVNPKYEVLGEPGWPELAACTASMHSVRIVLTASFSMAALSLATVRLVFMDILLQRSAHFDPIPCCFSNSRRVSSPRK